MSDALSPAESRAPALPAELESRGVEPAAGALVPPEDEDAYRKRREAEFHELVYPLYPRLRRFSLGLLKSRADAEDATQDAMLGGWKADVVEVCGRDGKRIWCYMRQSVYCASMNMRRKDAKRHNALARFADVVRWRKQPAVVNVVAAREKLDFMLRVVREMDPEYGAAYIEVVLLGARLNDAAKTLATNINTLKTHVRMARREMRLRLAAAGFDSDSDVEREEKEDTP
jgi:DNA-directed RNA polymerase specialized sigma24 family protein